MAKKRTGRLAGLAALAGAAYMINEKLGKDKDAKFQKDRIDQTSKRIPNDVASSENTTAKKDVVSSVNTTAKLETPKKYSSAYNPVASRDTLGQAARNLGVGDATNGMDLPKPAPKPAPVVTNTPSAPPVQVNRTAGGDPSQSKGVLRSDRDMTQAEAKTILNQTPADKDQQAAKDRKVIDSNKANSRKKRKAYQRNTDAAKVANLKSNAEFNRKQRAKKAAEAHAAKMKRLKANPELQAAEPLYPEQLLTPGGGYKTAVSLAKNLANRGYMNALSNSNCVT
jgi:hypothetical protein